MRRQVVWIFCWALVPWTAFGQDSQWESLVCAATRDNAQGTYTEAEARFGEAQKVAESFGPFDRRLAITMNNLAEIYLREAKYGEAEPLLKRALGIWEKDRIVANLDVATTLNNLAALYTYQRRFGEAEPVYRKCLALREGILGPNHPDVANTLKIREKAFGPEHPSTVECLNNLAVAYTEEGKFSEAERSFSQVVTILTKQPKQNAPKLAIVYENMANLYRREGSPRKAKKMLKMADGFRDLENSPS